MAQPHTTDVLSFPLSEIFHKFSSADLKPDDLMNLNLHHTQEEGPSMLRCLGTLTFTQNNGGLVLWCICISHLKFTRDLFEGV